MKKEVTSEKESSEQPTLNENKQIHLRWFFKLGSTRYTCCIICAYDSILSRALQ